MQARKLLAAILAAGINTVAFAEKSPLSYTSVGVAYLTGQADSNVYSGYWVGASLAAGDVAYFLVQQNAITTEKKFFNGFTNDDYEGSSHSVGIGLHMPATPRADWVAEVSRVEQEAEIFNTTTKGDGYMYSVGIRSKPDSRSELSAMIDHEDIEGENETGFTLGARVDIQKHVSAGIGYSYMGEADTLVFSMSAGI